MNVRAFIGEMELLAPPDLAEEFDCGRIGLIVEGRPEVSNVCCALDATPSVVRRAVETGADMLVVHHTPLWKPVTALTGPTASLMRQLLAADMNLYVMHTNFDHSPEGVNDALAELLALENRIPLSLGLIGSCTIPIEELARRLGGNIRIWGELTSLSRLAMVAGSGFDPAFLEEAKQAGADVFLSAELKHSVARSSPLPCIEATHYALEAPAMRRLALRKGWQFFDDPPTIRSLI
ncbi:MAG: Nif3-like dinuclear metal center hexameric protein [Methanoregula sp.]|nr:Nif3-like dinuclear metal center hexameric protein [Methanoregula sp.]